MMKDKKDFTACRGKVVLKPRTSPLPYELHIDLATFKPTEVKETLLGMEAFITALMNELAQEREKTHARIYKEMKSHE